MQALEVWTCAWISLGLWMRSKSTAIKCEVRFEYEKMSQPQLGGNLIVTHQNFCKGWISVMIASEK